MGGGAWPFLVGGVICLVDSVNERDLGLLNRDCFLTKVLYLLRRTFRFYRKEVRGNNRSVMPLDVLGCTRATMTNSTGPCMPERALANPLNVRRDGARLLQLLIFNEECLVNACHQHALITSLPFVHTARRTYRLNEPVKTLDSLDA